MPNTLSKFLPSLRLAFGAVFVAIIAIAVTHQGVRPDGAGIRDFVSELTTVVKNGPSRNYKRTGLVPVGDFQNQLSIEERWAYVAGTWDALRFITYYYDDKRFGWLADCQEGNIGDKGFSPVDVERQLNAGLHFGLDPDYPATAATILGLAASCAGKQQ